MNNHNPTPGTPEADALRDAATDAGLTELISPESVGVSLESPDDFLARMKREDAQELPQPIAKSKVPRRRAATIAALAVAAAALLVLGVIQPWHPTVATADTPPVLDYEFAKASNIAYAPGEDATAELLKLSDIASQTTLDQGSGPIQHVLTSAMFATISEDGAEKASAAQIPKIVESWIDPDGSLRTTETNGKPLGPDGRGLTKAAKSQQPATDSDDTFAAGSVDSQFIANLDSSPAAVREALLKRTRCPAHDRGSRQSLCLYQQITDLYSRFVVPPKIASAFWQTLADEGRFRLLGTVQDRDRRSGIGISFIPESHPFSRLILIISPKTGQLLGTEEILIKQQPDLDVHVPAILSFTAILSADFVKTQSDSR